MTYADDIARRDHEVGYYLAFDGIVSRLATHDFSSSTWGGLSGTYVTGLQAPSMSGGQLDRRLGVVSVGGFSARLIHSDAVNSFFARRGGTETTLSLAVSAATTTVVLGSGTNTYANSTLIHVDKEAITLGTHTSAGTYTGCTRGENNSHASEHSAGALISDRPRHWLGRRVLLVAVNLHMLAEGATPTTTTIATGILGASPRFSSGMWELELYDAMRELNRPICTGWQEVTVSGEALAFTDDVVAITMGDGARNFSDHQDGFVRLVVDDAQAIYRLDKDDVDHSGGTITLRTGPIWRTPSFLLTDVEDILREDDPPEITLRQVHVFENEDPALIALRVMHSHLGTGVRESTYDLLPGVEPNVSTSTADLVRRRMGAGLWDDQVDTAAWEAMEGKAQPITITLDEEMSLVDFLAREIVWLLGGYVRVTAAGLLSFGRYDVAIPDSSIITVTEDDIVGGNVSTVDDETAAPSSARIQCNWDPVTRSYRDIIEMSWVDVSAIYGDERAPLDLTSRSLRVGRAVNGSIFGAPTSSDIIVSAFDRVYSRAVDGLRRVSFALPWRWHLTFVPGYAFALTDARMPDHEGSDGVTARRYEVTSAEPQSDRGVVLVEAEEMPIGKLLAPGFFVGSFSDPTITADTAGIEAGYFDADPCFDFPDGADVDVFDASASPPFSAVDTLTISIASGTTLAVDSDASFGIAAGDWVQLANGANTSSLATTTNADVQDHAFMVDAGGEIDNGGATEREGTKWR